MSSSRHPVYMYEIWKLNLFIVLVSEPKSWQSSVVTLAFDLLTSKCITTGCPKSKVTILIVNNLLMKEIVWMRLSWYLVVFLKFCVKPINLWLWNFTYMYLAKGDYQGVIGDFKDNVTIQKFKTFSNKRLPLFSCFNSNTKVLITPLFCIFMMLLRGSFKKFCYALNIT